MCSNTHFGFLVRESKDVTKPVWKRSVSDTGMPATPTVTTLNHYYTPRQETDVPSLPQYDA